MIPRISEVADLVMRRLALPRPLYCLYVDRSFFSNEQFLDIVNEMTIDGVPTINLVHLAEQVSIWQVVDGVLAKGNVKSKTGVYHPAISHEVFWQIGGSIGSIQPRVLVTWVDVLGPMWRGMMHKIGAMNILLSPKARDDAYDAVIDNVKRFITMATYASPSYMKTDFIQGLRFTGDVDRDFGRLVRSTVYTSAGDRPIVSLGDEVAAVVSSSRNGGRCTHWSLGRTAPPVPPPSDKTFDDLSEIEAVPSDIEKLVILNTPAFSCDFVVIVGAAPGDSIRPFLEHPRKIPVITVDPLPMAKGIVTKHYHSLLRSLDSIELPATGQGALIIDLRADSGREGIAWERQILVEHDLSVRLLREAVDSKRFRHISMKLRVARGFEDEMTPLPYRRGVNVYPQAHIWSRSTEQRFIISHEQVEHFNDLTADMDVYDVQQNAIDWAFARTPELESVADRAIIESVIRIGDMAKVCDTPDALTVALFSVSNINNNRGLTREMLQKHTRMLCCVPDLRIVQSWNDNRLYSGKRTITRHHRTDVYSDHAYSFDDFVLTDGKRPMFAYLTPDALANLSYSLDGSRIQGVSSYGCDMSDGLARLWMFVSNYGLSPVSTQNWLNMQTYRVRMISTSLRLAFNTITKDSLHIFRRLVLRFRIFPKWMNERVHSTGVVLDTRVTGWIQWKKEYGGGKTWVAVAGHFNSLLSGDIDFQRQMQTVASNMQMVLGTGHVRRGLIREDNQLADSGVLGESGIRKALLRRANKEYPLWHSGPDWICAVASTILMGLALNLTANPKAYNHVMRQLKELSTLTGFWREGFQARSYRAVIRPGVEGNVTARG